MKITNVKIKTTDANSKLKAFADITFDEQMTFKGFKIFDGAKGLFLGKPSRQGKDGKYYDDIWYEDEDFGKTVEAAALEAYNSNAGVNQTPRQSGSNNDFWD